MVKKWGEWHIFVNKWDGMRPKLPNYIHQSWPWCHIPPILALSGAIYYLPIPIWFGPHSPPPATKTSPSCRLLSPRLHLLATYRCGGFSSCQHLPPSLLSVACLLPPSLFVVTIYSLILQCELPAAIAHATIEHCLNYPWMPHPFHITSYWSPTTIELCIALVCYLIELL